MSIISYGKNSHIEHWIIKSTEVRLFLLRGVLYEAVVMDSQHLRASHRLLQHANVKSTMCFPIDTMIFPP